jgi:hypothetical protein
VCSERKEQPPKIYIGKSIFPVFLPLMAAQKHKVE